MDNRLFADSLLDVHQTQHSGQVELTPGNTASLLQLSAPDPANPPGIVLSWDVEQFGNVFAATTARLFLELEWGIGKAPFVASVDAKKGGRVFLAATTLTVKARYSVGVGRSVRVGAAAVYGSADTPRPTLTSEIVPIAFGASAVVAIPKYAEDVVVYPLSANAFPTYAQVDFLAGESGLLAAAFNTSSSVVHEPVRIPGGADFVHVTNNSGALMGYAVTFGLAL